MAKRKVEGIRAGSIDAEIFALLRRHAGELSVSELAPLMPRKRGQGTAGDGFGQKESSAQSAISKVLNIVKQGKGDTFAALSQEQRDTVFARIKPRGYSEGGAGRKAAPLASAEALGLDDLLADVENDSDSDDSAS